MFGKVRVSDKVAHERHGLCLTDGSLVARVLSVLQRGVYDDPASLLYLLTRVLGFQSHRYLSTRALQYWSWHKLAFDARGVELLPLGTCLVRRPLTRRSRLRPRP